MRIPSPFGRRSVPSKGILQRLRWPSSSVDDLEERRAARRTRRAARPRPERDPSAWVRTVTDPKDLYLA